jgi:histidinol dehydrogenase
MIKIYSYPEKRLWGSLAVRPELKRGSLDSLVQAILKNVRSDGDSAVRKYSKEFDGISARELRVTELPRLK